MSFKNTGTFESSRRADLSELLDEPCSYEDLRGCLRDLEQVNRVSFGYRPTLEWLEQFVPEPNHPLHIVDVGCGGGDMLRRIESWAAPHRVAVNYADGDVEAKSGRPHH